jgi:PKD repeat protein
MRILLVLIAVILLIGVVSADTLITYAMVEGSYWRGTNSDWSLMRDGIGQGSEDLTTYDRIQLYSTASSGVYDINYRFSLYFNTTDIPDTNIIDSAVITAYFSSGDNALGGWNVSVIDIIPERWTAVSDSDYNRTTFTRVANDFLYTDLPAVNGTINFTITNLNYINKTGLTPFMFTSSKDVDNITPTWASLKFNYLYIRSIDYAGGTKKPYITITYTPPPDTTPPASITGLSNTTTCNSINWSFTKPSDADYNGLMVWKNGTFFHNLSSSATSDLWLNLTELTEYTFSSKTFDATNNINATFVNRTSTTAKCPPAPIASFISNVTCGIVPFRVQFNDTTYSSTNLTGWNWSLGDGNYSAVQNPVFEYNMSGMFTVNINATNAWGSNISQIPNYMRGVPDWATCPVTPTPTPTWQPEINPSTEVDIQPNGWWLIAGGLILFVWFVFRRTR